MISFDANLLLYAINTASPCHEGARKFLETMSRRGDVGLSELVLVEVYTLLRNPAVLTNPMSPTEAVSVIQTFRRHPQWAVLGFPTESVALHEELWRLAAQSGLARRRIYDVRLALALRRHGVTEFATANIKDFDGLGFDRVWNPLAGQGGN